MKNAEQKGFTLLELLFVMVILSILASLSWGAFLTYKKAAEYSKAESLMKDAQTAISLGNMESGLGTVHGYVESGTEGGILPDEMQEFLPGAVTPKDVALGALLEVCVDNEPMINMFLVARPCKSDMEVSWVQFCDGTQIYNEHIASAGC